MSRAWRAALRRAPLAGAVVILILVVAPLVTLLVTSLSTAALGASGEFTLRSYGTLFSRERERTELVNTAIFVAGTSVLTVVLAAALAWIVTSTDVPLRGVMRAAPVIAVFLPSLLRLTGWIELYSPNTGLVNAGLQRLLGLESPPFDIYSMWGMIAVETITIVPIPYLTLLGPFAALDSTPSEVARTLGAGRVDTLRRVIVPSLAPAFLSALVLSVVIAARSFEVPLLLGAPVGIETFMSAIYRSVTGSPPNYNLASAQAMLYVVLAIVFLICYNAATRIERRFAVLGGRGYTKRVTRLGRWRFLAAAFVLGYFLLSFAQLMVISVLVSLVPFYTVTAGNPFATLTLDNYSYVLELSYVPPAIATSVRVSAIAAVITVIVALAFAYVSLKTRMPGRRTVELLGTLPVAIPALVFSVALLMTVLSLPPLRVLYSTNVPMIIGLVIVFLPYALRIVSSALIQVSDEMLEASRVSGASGLRTTRSILLPLLTLPMVGALSLLFVEAFRELATIALLVTPDTFLLPAVIFAAIQGSRTWGEVSALNVISVLIPLTILALAFVLQRIVTAYGPARRHMVNAAPQLSRVA